MSNVHFVNERRLTPRSGFPFFFLAVLLLLSAVALFILGGISFDTSSDTAGGICMVTAVVFLCVGAISLGGLKIIKPNEALVLSLFGKYYGTIYDAGFWFVNPFTSNLYPKAKAAEMLAQVKSNPVSVKNLDSVYAQQSKVSLKISTFVNGNQKVNDSLGNPIEVSAIVMWRVTDATKAVLNVDYYPEYLSNQTDSTIRNIARLYPYDIIDDDESDSDDKNEKTLRGSATLIAEEMKSELSRRVSDAGLEIIEVRLNQIAYAPEIAAAMLQRQQAIAVIAARKKIVEGAVSMVEMALEQLKRDGVVDLDEERKAQMVSNLLVVLCSSKEASPVVNSGSLY